MSDIYSSDQTFANEGIIVTHGIEPLQWTDFITFFSAFATVLRNSGVFGPNSVDYVVWQDNQIKWPVNEPPFAIVEPTQFPWGEEGVGGGRYSKTYTSDFKIHIVVTNILDISYKDTNLVTSTNSQLGAYKLVDLTINVIEQSFPLDPLGNLTLVELPYAVTVDPPVRYVGSNEYSDIVITFHIKICEKMFSVFADAMPT